MLIINVFLYETNLEVQNRGEGDGIIEVIKEQIKYILINKFFNYNE